MGGGAANPHRYRLIRCPNAPKEPSLKDVLTVRRRLVAVAPGAHPSSDGVIGTGFSHTVEFSRRVLPDVRAGSLREAPRGLRWAFPSGGLNPSMGLSGASNCRWRPLRGRLPVSGCCLENLPAFPLSPPIAVGEAVPRPGNWVGFFGSAWTGLEPT
jgi:hypothetical protein